MQIQRTKLHVPVCGQVQPRGSSTECGFLGGTCVGNRGGKGLHFPPTAAHTTSPSTAQQSQLLPKCKRLLPQVHEPRSQVYFSLCKCMSHVPGTHSALSLSPVVVVAVRKASTVALLSVILCILVNLNILHLKIAPQGGQSIGGES